MTEAYEAIHVSAIPDPEEGKPAGSNSWRPIRIHFGIRSFGTNAYAAGEAGGELIEEHTEVDDSETSHEELYVVAEGHATFTIDGEEIDAPAGTLVYVRDPALRRGAVAREKGTTVFCFGGTPGEAFTVSPWEQKHEAHEG